MFVIMLTISTILYALSDYLKAVVLCLKLKGPPAKPFIGNILAIGDKDSKWHSIEQCYTEIKCTLNHYRSFMSE